MKPSLDSDCGLSLCYTSVLYNPKTEQASTFSTAKRRLHKIYAINMFRTALIQSLKCASKQALRSHAPVAQQITPCSFAILTCSNPRASFQPSRYYSVPAGLAKQEVEGRIMDLLKNFDKA